MLGTFGKGRKAKCVQRSPLFCANIVKNDPGRARQNSLATAGTNFTKPAAQNKGDFCNCLCHRNLDEGDDLRRMV